MNNFVFDLYCTNFMRTLIDMVHDKVRLKLYYLKREKLDTLIDSLKNCVLEAVK